MIVQKLINVGMYVCSKCAYYVNQEDGMTECRFPADMEKKCSVKTSGDSWIQYAVYDHRWEEEK